VRLLFDQNLSPLLPKNLDDLFPGSIHVRSIGLESAGDRTVWEHAAAHNLVIATKDSDFFGWALLQQLQAKVIWIAAGNCSTRQIESAFRDQHQAITESFEDDHTSVFVLFWGDRRQRR
jgi:predicted nuclease of predicted toxin-antitoxin system